MSAHGHNAELQIAALEQAGCRKVFVEKTKRAGAKGSAWAECLATLNPGDVLTVWKLDRLGHSLPESVMMLDALKRKEVGFHSITDAIDTTTPLGRTLFDMIGVLADTQRAQVTERIQAGRKAAMAGGVKMGRKRSLSPQQVKHARALIAGGQHPRNIAKSFETSLATLYRALSLEGDRT